MEIEIKTKSRVAENSENSTVLAIPFIIITRDQGYNYFIIKVF